MSEQYKFFPSRWSLWAVAQKQKAGWGIINDGETPVYGGLDTARQAMKYHQEESPGQEFMVVSVLADISVNGCYVPVPDASPTPPTT